METRTTRRTTKNSRASKNSHLYDNLERLATNEHVIDLNTQTKIDLNMLDKPPMLRKEFRAEEKFSEEVIELQNKIYDINKVLEEARKSKPEDDKDRFRAQEYSLIADLNRKYIEQRERQTEELEREGIEEVIKSITNSDLKEEFRELLEYDTNEKELMGDLIATNADLNSQLEDGKFMTDEGINTEDMSDSGHLVNSFYTRSMDLSEDDFEFKDLVEKEKSNMKIIILVVAITLLILTMIGIFVLSKIGVI